MLFTRRMTAQAATGRLLTRQRGKTNDIGWISGFSMLPAGAVARFTTLPLGTFGFGRRKLRMRPLVVGLPLFLVATPARFHSNEFSRIYRWSAAGIACGLTCRFIRVALSLISFCSRLMLFSCCLRYC